MTATRTATTQRGQDQGRHDRADGAEGDARGRPAQALRAHRAGEAQAEEHVREQVDRRPGDHRRDLGAGELLGRVGDDELVPDGRDDHARDQHHVEVCVRVARHRRAVGGELEAALGDPRDVGEVQPPQRGAAQEGQREGRHAREAELELARGGAGQDDRLAQRDDDEELEALGEVRGLHVPGRRRHRLQAGDAEHDQRRAVVERQRGEPERRARRAVGHARPPATAPPRPRTRSGSARPGRARASRARRRRTSGTRSGRPGWRRRTRRRAARAPRTPAGSRSPWSGWRA